MRDLERANLRTVITGMLDAPFFGFTPLELVWRFDGDWWHIVDIVPKPYHWFRFDSRNNPVFVGEYGLYCADPRPLPLRQVRVRHTSCHLRQSLRPAPALPLPVAGELQTRRPYVLRPFCGTSRDALGRRGSSGGSRRAGKAGHGARTFAYGTRRVAVIPHGANVKLESAGQTQGALHEDFLARQDRAISKVLMGQTLTIETDGKNSLAATEAHKSVADDLADADKAMVTDAWNEIAWLYAQVNAGPGVLAPLAEYDEPEDLNVPG